MSTDLLSLFGAIQRGDKHAIASHLFPTSAATVCKSLPQDKNEVSPTVDARTAGVDIHTAQYRQEIYTYERLIESLYDLARANRYDELHDMVRAKYLAIHGEPR